MAAWRGQSDRRGRRSEGAASRSLVHLSWSRETVSHQDCWRVFVLAIVRVQLMYGCAFAVH